MSLVKMRVKVLVIAVLVLSPLFSAMRVVAIDGNQWQDLIQDKKELYVKAVIETWMHEAHLVDVLKSKVPDTSAALGSTFQTFLPCLAQKQASPRHIAMIVDQYLAEHINQRPHSMAAIVWTAVYEYCR
jgi:hypothetical protein